MDCTSCNRVFSSARALHAHCVDKADHAYCVSCERLFVHFEALSQHMKNSSFHWDDSDEDEDEESDSGSDEETRFCSSCNRWFTDRASLYQHLAASLKHNWCFLCSRDFATSEALAQHSRSKIHMSRDLCCPLCPQKFTVPSAIALHIESGVCHNFSRRQVTEAVHSLKLAQPISVSRRLQNGSTAGPTIITYSASERAFNGTAYECYICHRTFRTLVSLNMHLNSPAHDANEFMCPRCKRKYKLISGLIQHIEAESCGIAKFQQVEDYTNALTNQFTRLLKL